MNSPLALPGCHEHQRRCPPQSTSQTFLWNSTRRSEIWARQTKASPLWITNKHVFMSASQRAHYSIFLVTGWLYNAWGSCERRDSVLPRSSSPAVSLEGATLMHRLVNLRTKRHFSYKTCTIWTKQAKCSTRWWDIHVPSSDPPGCLRGIWCLLNAYRQAQRQRGRKLYLMGSLVALSLTVEEKEEWVLSSNRKDNAAFAVSKQRHRGQIKDTKGEFCHIVTGERVFLHLQACVCLSAGIC